MSENIAELLARDIWVRKHGGPLYSQLSQHIEAAIRSGAISEGDPLPSEREIAQISGLSRVTVRKAVQELVRDGFVIQRQGSGTSVAPKPERVQQSLSRLTSFSEDMQRRGMNSRSEWLERGIFTPSPRECMALGLSADANVARISRLRIADGMPLAIERASLSAETVPEPDEIGESLYAYLAGRGKKPSRAIQRISARVLDARDAKLLGVPEGSAGLRIERISYLPDGRTVEFTQSVYRGNAYDFIAELRIVDEEPRAK